MPTDYGVNIQVKKIEALQAFLADLPRGTIRAAIAAVGEYIIGNDRRGLKHYAPWQFIGRPKAYGKVSDAPEGYFSWKQFRFVMWLTHSGDYTPGAHNRTGKTAEGWQSSFTSNGYNMRLYNTTRGAKYITGDTTQARQPALVGHRKFSAVIEANITGALRAGKLAVTRWLKERQK